MIIIILFSFLVMVSTIYTQEHLPEPPAQLLFYQACLKAQKNAFYSNLEQGVSPIEPNDQGRTPLHAVCLGKNNLGDRLHIAQKLILLSEPNPRDNNGTTPLHLACSQGRVALVELLAAHNASLVALENSYNQPLQTALSSTISLEKKYAIAKVLLHAADKRHEVLTTIPNKHGGFLLHEAIYILHRHQQSPEYLKYRLIKLILDHTPTNMVNMPKTNGKSPLYMLIEAGIKKYLSPQSTYLLIRDMSSYKESNVNIWNIK